MNRVSPTKTTPKKAWAAPETSAMSFDADRMETYDAVVPTTRDNSEKKKE
jgi:hypothetical protein